MSTSCSLVCYRPHKADHELQRQKQEQAASAQALGLSSATVEAPASKPVDRPGTNQRIPKRDFSGFAEDPEFRRLLVRFPLLPAQLQLVYGVTLEPGPDEARSWSRQAWYSDGVNRDGVSGGGVFRRGGRGRGRGSTRGGRGRGFGRGWHGGGATNRVDLPYGEKAPDDVQHGPWTQEKGDNEGLDVIRKMRNASDEVHAEGMEEFVQLCRLKFGEAA